MSRITLIVTLMLAFAFGAFAQPQRIASAVHFQHTINSQAVAEERTILVQVPANYERTEARYPVVYMLDAHAPQNAMMAGLVEQQAWGGVMPEVIVVGIQNTNRTRDMTPTPGDRQGAGGAAKFLQFIETEVIPFVNKNYRTEPYRVLAGHSLAGLFTVYAMIERPDAFNAYVAASPYLHWDKNHLVKRAEEMLKSRPEMNNQLFVGLGNEPEYLNAYNSFEALLKQTKPKKLEYEFRQFKEENHGSVVLPAYYAGLRKVYEGWQTPENGTFADLESHYRKLSSRYGYTVKPPEALVNRAGYQMLNAGNMAEAIAVFKKNVENYPRSANVYDSLGEAYEKNGDEKAAREHYEKAWKMAEQNGETQLATTARANYERIAAKNK
jgi:hypothetical protein